MVKEWFAFYVYPLLQIENFNLFTDSEKSVYLYYTMLIATTCNLNLQKMQFSLFFKHSAD